VGQRWRVYTSRLDGGGGPLYSGLCSGNQLLAESVEIPALPARDEEDPSRQDSVPLGVLLAIGAAALLAVASALAFRRGGVRGSQ
jgi:drug/metabolite transporter (DMT)-like permease